MGLRGNLPAFAEGFLSFREFCVRVRASHSEYFVQEEGPPQGSVLSVTLFVITINEITKQLGSEVHCTLYVDDFTIFVSAAAITHSTRIIQIAINNLEQWTKTKGTRFSIEKAAAIKFEKRKKGEEPQLTLHGSRIQVRESTRYLGLIIDKRLNWKDHMDHLRAKCTSSVNLISTSSTCHGGLTEKRYNGCTQHSCSQNWIMVNRCMVHQNLTCSNAWNPFKMHPLGPSQGPSGHLQQ